jgi:hypothetical protein
VDEEGGGVLVTKRAWTRSEEGLPPSLVMKRAWTRREEGGWATTSLVKKRVQMRGLLPGEEMSRNDYLLPGGEMSRNEKGGGVPLVKKRL